MLHSPREVVRCLLTYTDWWQPATTSILPVGAARRQIAFADGLRPGLLDRLDERTELCRRMEHLEDRDRRLLYLWYVKQAPVDRIAREIGVSRRHFFRRRSRAIQTIIDVGRDDDAA